MNLKNSRVQAAVFIIILAAVGWFALRKPSNDQKPEQNNKSAEQGQSTNQQGQQISPANNSSETPSQAWEGTLQASDSLSKGNYYIVVDGHKVYIKTSRDFSGLVGKEVRVTYQGTLENFALGNITAK